jgi:hypothetical protein
LAGGRKDLTGEKKKKAYVTGKGKKEDKESKVKL